MASQRARYTRDQLTQYFDRIELPRSAQVYDISSLPAEKQVDYLRTLQKYTLCSVPFENLSLHYSHHHQVCLHPDELFRKVVNEKRGGYCMELNAVFGTVLRSVGFKLYSAGARVYKAPGKGYGSWSHMINLVTIDTQKYWVDVGFGPNGPTHPVALPHPKANGVEETNIEPAWLRLEYKAPEGTTDLEQRLWCFAHRINKQTDYEECYCFTEIEFMPADYESMNYYTSTSPKTWFTQRIVCAGMLMSEDGQIEGQVILGDDLKIRKHGETVLKKAFESEDDRLQALKEHFGITFTLGERDGILGRVSQIKDKKGGPDDI